MTDDQAAGPGTADDRDREPETENGDRPSGDGDREIDALRADLEAFEEEIEQRTVHRDEIERDLKRYVRRRVRRGHARGWGPYLVLLYGTAMTLGAFYFLTGGWAILAMLVVWLSTLGLYVLMLLVGATLSVAGVPRRLYERVRRFRG
jgi:Flp pilus assembly protein TadB